MVPLISCRNAVTGAEAEIPETALDHMSDWVPVKDGQPADPSDRALGDTAQDPAAEAPDQSPAKPAPRTTTAKSKAADTASKEGK